ncbi:uncharacterized protein [Ranitomeya imitator]|uniref:uncharacterized protein n=1 Tax=Ranitomeya imitator TaxID=111125 RepID=UPI0037E71D17
MRDVHDFKTNSVYKWHKPRSSIRSSSISSQSSAEGGTDVLDVQRFSSTGRNKPVKDLHLFARKLVLHKLHQKKNSDNILWTTEERETIAILNELCEESQPVASRSKFTLPKPKRFPPLNLFPEIETFVKVVTEDLRKIPVESQHDNLTRGQRQALTELRSLKQVLIKPADKGGNVVLWPTEMYEKEAFRQLRDEDTYRRLSFNPTSVFQAELYDILDEAFTDGLITKDLRDGLIPDAPRTPCLYLLPKIHKNPMCPSGRPIVSGNGGLTENIAVTALTSLMCVSIRVMMTYYRVTYIGRRHRSTVCYTPHLPTQDILRTVSPMDNFLEQNVSVLRRQLTKNKQKISLIGSWIEDTHRGWSDDARGEPPGLIGRVSCGPKGNLKHPTRLSSLCVVSSLRSQETFTDTSSCL